MSESRGTPTDLPTSSTPGAGARVASALPWLSLAGGVAAAAVTGLVWRRLDAVDRLALASDSVVFLAAVAPLRARSRRGWGLLVAGTLLQVPYGLAAWAADSSGGGPGFVRRSAGVVAVLVGLRWLRPHYRDVA